MNLVQLDDGFQTAWGDWWIPNNKFQRGLPSIASIISERGFMPGLWLAPVSVDKFSVLIKEHPNWILRYKNSRPADCGCNGRFTTGLDITKTEVQEFLAKLIHDVVHVWGFKYLKLDFLYACIALGERSDKTITRAEAFQLALSIIRQSAGDDIVILGWWERKNHFS